MTKKFSTTIVIDRDATLYVNELARNLAKIPRHYTVSESATKLIPVLFAKPEYITGPAMVFSVDGDLSAADMEMLKEYVNCRLRPDMLHICANPMDGTFRIKEVQIGEPPHPVKTLHDIVEFVEANKAWWVSRDVERHNAAIKNWLENAKTKSFTRTMPDIYRWLNDFISLPDHRPSESQGKMNYDRLFAEARNWVARDKVRERHGSGSVGDIGRQMDEACFELFDNAGLSFHPKFTAMLESLVVPGLGHRQRKGYAYALLDRIDPVIKVKLESLDDESPSEQIVEFRSSVVLKHNNLTGPWAALDSMQQMSLAEDYALWSEKRRYGDEREWHVEMQNHDFPALHDGDIIDWNAAPKAKPAARMR